MMAIRTLQSGVFWWRNLDGGAGEPGELFDVLALLADDGARSLDGDEHLYHSLLWSHEGAKGSSPSATAGRRWDRQHWMKLGRDLQQPG